MRRITVWGRRVSIAVLLALAASSINIPLPGIAGAAPPSSSSNRILIDQPDPPDNNVPAPALPPGAPVKQIPTTVISASVHLNHVSKLTPADVQSLQAHGYTILDNMDGRIRVQTAVSGKAQQFLIADAKLRSGKEVIGFGVYQPANQPTAGLIGTTVQAWSWGFGWCSYAYMNSSGGDLHVHLCAQDSPYVLAIALVIAAAVGALIGIVVGIGCGEICGPIVGVAAISILSIALIGYWWLHSDRYGNTDIVIPHWTMVSPFGGYILWVNSGRWDYMSNQCWILDNRWYDRYC